MNGSHASSTPTEPQVPRFAVDSDAWLLAGNAAIVGPAFTGKSTLARDLVWHLRHSPRLRHVVVVGDMGTRTYRAFQQHPGLERVVQWVAAADLWNHGDYGADDGGLKRADSSMIPNVASRSSLALCTDTLFVVDAAAGSGSSTVGWRWLAALAGPHVTHRTGNRLILLVNSIYELPSLPSNQNLVDAFFLLGDTGQIARISLPFAFSQGLSESEFLTMFDDCTQRYSALVTTARRGHGFHWYRAAAHIDAAARAVADGGGCACRQHGVALLSKWFPNPSLARMVHEYAMAPLCWLSDPRSHHV